MTFRFSFIVFLLFTALSCSNDSIYSESYPFSEMHWGKEEIVDFNVNITDIKSLYNIRVTIVHTTSYIYSNLLLGLTVITPDGTERISSYDLQLKDPDRNFTGIVQGKDIVYEFDAMMKAGFTMPGKYILRFQQFMPGLSVSGLKELNIEILRAHE